MRFALRRRICRATFLLVCVVPTLLVGATAVVVSTPSYQRMRIERWRERLANQLGLDVHFSHWEWIDQNQLVMHALELRDPESQVVLASARTVRVTPGRQGPVVLLGQPTLNFARFPRLLDVLHEHLLLRTAGTAAVSIDVSSPTLVLEGEPNSDSVLDVRFVLDARDDATEALLEFRSTDAPADETTRLRVVRNRQIDPPATGWELHTGDTGLPCQLVQAWLPQAEQLGDRCRFLGSVWSERLPDGWEVELSGSFVQLDLDRFVTGQFPHKLSGIADVTFTRLVLHQSQVVEAEGTLASSQGVISQTLIQAAAQHLDLQQPGSATDNILTRYEDLWLQFVLDDRGLMVAGRDDGLQTILADNDGPLLTSGATKRVAAHSLVKLLVPISDLQVPAARETTTLISALPMPAVTPGKTAPAKRTGRPLRLVR